MYKFIIISLLFAVLTVIVCQTQVKKAEVCPSIKLYNGRIRYKQRGKLAKFQCNTGYYMIGERYSMCTKGKWDAIPPVCAKPGCSKVKAPANCSAYSTFRGSYVNFYCDPGYTIRGPSSTYCDGYQWMYNLPTCLKTGTEPATSCDFESEDLCGWSQDLNHEFDWRRYNLFTPSGYAGTGPSYDHTKGPGGDGYYMYIESSSRVINDTARLISPLYHKMENGLCFTFYYHMFGSGTGQLRVYIKNETDTTHIKYMKPLFWVSGNQGNRWRKGTITLRATEENFQVIIEGVRGSTYISDIAIDDIFLSESCPEEEILVSTTTTDYSSEAYPIIESCLERCGNISMNTDTSSSYISCDCDDGCIGRNTCCLDYITTCLFGQVSDMTEPNEDAWTTATNFITKQTEIPKEQTIIYLKYTKKPQQDQTKATQIHSETKEMKINQIERSASEIQPKPTIESTQPTRRFITKSEPVKYETKIQPKLTIKPTEPTRRFISKSEPVKYETKPIPTTIQPVKPSIFDLLKNMTKIKQGMVNRPKKYNNETNTGTKPLQTTNTNQSVTKNPDIPTTIQPVKPSRFDLLKNMTKIKQGMVNITKNYNNETNTGAKPPQATNANDINKKQSVMKKPDIIKIIPKTTTTTTTTTAPTTTKTTETFKTTKSIPQTTTCCNGFTEEETQETPSIMTDYDETSEEVVERHENVKSIGPHVQMLSEIEQINKIQRNNNTNIVLAIICSLIFITLVLISAVFAIRKYRIRLCSRLRFRHTGNSDSLSDVRFLANDEILDFNLRYAD